MHPRGVRNPRHVHAVVDDNSGIVRGEREDAFHLFEKLSSGGLFVSDLYEPRASIEQGARQFGRITEGRIRNRVQTRKRTSGHYLLASRRARIRSGHAISTARAR